VGQALSAAIKTVAPNKHVHSLHSYFLMAGDPKKNIVYFVQNLRDGTSFASRLVTASQQGKTIFVLVASFQVPHPIAQPVIEHQWKMPTVPPPEELRDFRYYYQSLADDPRCPESWKPFLTRRTDPNMQSPIEVHPAIVIDSLAPFGEPPANRPAYPILSRDVPRQALWIRAKAKLADDPTLHAAVLAFASDMNLLTTARFTFNMANLAVVASLDHAMWFHSPFKADDWLLYVLESPRATDGRGLAFGAIFTRAGVLAVSVAQEGVMRPRVPKAKM
jgi:acyl-CoA thioesterase II